ncbi:MAG: hypothetical protein AB1564_12800 [Chloroflexota bacterium]
MNHRPFEDWLLDDKLLKPEEDRELQLHLQACRHCAALWEANLALRSAKSFAPAPGFTVRFQARLAAQRVRQTRSQVIGGLLLVLAGLGLVVWLTGPYLLEFFSSPAAWITTWVGALLGILEAMRALGEAGSVLFRVIPGLIPPFAWMVLISGSAGLGLLWSVSLWRFTRVTRGA